MSKQYRAQENFDAGQGLVKKGDVVSYGDDVMKPLIEKKLVKAFDPEREAAKEKLVEDEAKAEAQEKKDNEARAKKGKG